jgi:hypothetical protein
VNLAWSDMTTPTAARLRRSLPDGTPDVAAHLADLQRAARPYRDGHAPEGTVPGPARYFGRARRLGRLWVALGEDVIGRQRPPGAGPLHDLAHHASGRVISRGYRHAVVYGAEDTADYWSATAPFADWPAVLLAYLDHEVTGTRRFVDWYCASDPGFYPTTRRRTGPGSGPRRPAAPLDWSTIPAGLGVA